MKVNMELLLFLLHVILYCLLLDIEGLIRMRVAKLTLILTNHGAGTAYKGVIYK